MHQPGDAEIDNLHASLFEDYDVGRLDIPMNDARLA
jgi:hypothetical protein